MSKSNQADEIFVLQKEFLDKMGRIDDAIRSSTDVEKIMSDVLQVTLEIFEVDRSWLLYPCDPTAKSWSVPMERTRPEYPGAHALGKNIVMTTEIQNAMRRVLGKDGIANITHSEKDITPKTATRFSIKSELYLAIYPIKGKPWMFGIHQCSHHRNWEKGEVLLMQWIGRRLSDALGSLLFLRELRESERLLKEAQHVARLGYLDWDPTSNEIVWSKETYNICGFPFDFKPTLESTLALIHEDDKKRVADAMNAAIKRKKNYNIEHRMLRPDGKTIYVHSKGELFLNKSGEVIRMLSTIIDTTQRKLAEISLKESEIRYRSIVESTVVGIIVISDKEGIITEWNTGAQKIFGYTSKEAISKSLDIIIPSHLRKKYKNGFKQAIKTEKLKASSSTHELTGLRKNGQEFPLELTINYWKRHGQINFSAIILDITKRKEAEEKILHQAHFDALTNLPNRFLAMDRLSHLLNEAKENNNTLAVLFLDLDNFKKVNDTLGHETGDKLLIEVAHRMQSTIGNAGIVGRLGGDEFIIILKSLENKNAITPIIKNLMNRFREIFRIEKREFILTVSVGIAMYPDDGTTPSELLRKADSAMYHVKKLGHNTYSYFTESMTIELSRRLALEEQIHGALNRGEFSVYYQPKLNVEYNRICGVEALLRWSNAKLGNVSPSEFIPIAEQTGTINTIGQFVLKQALSVAFKLQKKYDKQFHIAINLSPSQFREPGLVDFIKYTMQKFKVPGNTIELEITEGVLLNGYAYIKSALSSLNNLNVKIAMDDFGTGYSSLSYLRKYPFDILKIDRSFVTDIVTDEANYKLIHATIAMAKALNLKVVAEGVETQEQFNYLKRLGCEYVQGFLFGKPMPYKELITVLDSNYNKLSQF